MNCLENIVGIRGLCGGDTTPNSIYYINDLAGIGIKEADAAMDAEYANAYDFLKSKIDLAGDLIASKMRSYFNPRFKGGSVIEQHTVGIFQQNLNVANAQATYLVGKNFYIYRNPYFNLHLSKIGLHVDIQGNVDVFVYDLTSNKLLDTIVVAATAGEVSYVDVSKTYATEGQTMNLFIGYAATFASYKTNLTLNGCRTCRSPYTYSNPYISVTSSKILAASNKVDENLDSNSNNDGLSVTYSISCTFDPFVCSVKHMLAEAIWYKAGAMIAEELKYSKRFNSIVTLYKADATELIAMYEEKMMESLNSTLQNMRVPDNYCFECNKRVKLTLNLP
jgi:hypothetical protein